MMSNLIKKDDKNLIKLLHTKGGELVKPFELNIFLLTTHIAGTTHIDNMEEIEPKLYINQQLILFREAKNPYDENAILIKTSDGVKLGYVPMKHNPILSRLMDAGKLIYAKIKEKEILGNWVKVTIDIFLND